MIVWEAKMHLLWTIIFILLSLNAISVLTTSNPDEVFDLPGLSYKPNFRHYSGYLNASNQRYLHYWFVESQKSPSQDPLVLWMNGGPGCSSLDGLLSEHGPFHIAKDGRTVYNNPYSWNKVANVIFLEAPAGVGFSYSADRDYQTNDDQVASDNYLALQHFFKKFPQYKNNDFYITGESYGGIYVPTLSVIVLTGPANINFKGFAVGNGYLDRNLLGNSLVFFGYYHGLFGKNIWSRLSTYCCNGSFTQQTCNFVNPQSQDCLDVVSEVAEIIQFSGLNIYNLYADCQHSSSLQHSRLLADKRLLMNIFKTKRNISAQGDPPCIDSSNIAKWLNQPAVRKALHIPTNVQKWDICSGAVEMGYHQIYSTMKPQVIKLITSGKLRGLIYNGDIDMACNFLGDQWFSDSLPFQVTSEYSKWMYNDQVAGFYKKFGNLTFLTIKGSGHMVPQDKPGPAFKMMSSFLYQKPL
uniref:Carboxypeptidase n=1 Tax=Hadrurus spadix TaxID=141984 RepID=A0A1W7RAT1_9SCOR